MGKSSKQRRPNIAKYIEDNGGSILSQTKEHLSKIYPEMKEHGLFNQACYWFLNRLLATPIDVENADKEAYWVDSCGRKRLKGEYRRKNLEYAGELYVHFFCDVLDDSQMCSKYQYVEKLCGLNFHLTEQHERYALSERPILIIGETGTGKELIAQALYYLSRRRRGPFIPRSCGTLINQEMIISELFGHVKGSFTNAANDREGAFEAADGGTLFLDEIGEMLPVVQAAVLRAIERKSIQKLGETRESRQCPYYCCYEQRSQRSFAALSLGSLSQAWLGNKDETFA